MGLAHGGILLALGVTSAACLATIDESRIQSCCPSGGACESCVTSTCALAESGPVTVTYDGQVLERLRIFADGVPAVSIQGHRDVIVRDLEIRHVSAPGIRFSSAPGLVIERTSVVHVGAPPKGPNTSDAFDDIRGDDSADVRISHVRVERGSSGIYLEDCPRAELRFIEGHDLRGPVPHGTLVTFHRCDRSTLEDFSCENPVDTSWPGHNVHVDQSSDVTIRRGLLVGNNSPDGVGVMFQQTPGATGGTCDDVDTRDMGNASFGAYPAHGVTFRRTRGRDNHCDAQAGRPPPSSNSLIWLARPDSTGLRLLDSTYFAPCNPAWLLWDEGAFVAPVQIAAAAFEPRAPVRLSFCWQ